MKEALMMDPAKRARLESAGWRVGDASEFLGLDAAETELVALRLDLARGVRVERQRQGLSQAALAKRIASSQSRVAKLEAGDPSISFELLLRAYFGLGLGRDALARTLRLA